MARSSTGSSGWNLTNGSATPFGVGTNTGPWTFVFWFKLNAIGQTNTYIMAQGGNTFALIYGFDATNLELFSTISDTRTGSQISINDTVWHHVAYRKLAGTSSYDKFLDGVKTVIDPAKSLGVGSNAGVTFFQSGGDANRSNSQLAEVAIVNSALSDANIATLANGSVSLATLVGSSDAYWPLCGVASPEPDLGSNDWDLTVNNVTATTLYGIESPCGGVTGWSPEPIVSVSGGRGTDAPLSLTGINTLRADFIVVVAGWYSGSGGTEPVFTESESNSWNSVAAAEAVGSGSVRIYWKYNPTRSVSHVFGLSNTSWKSLSVSGWAINSAVSLDDHAEHINGVSNATIQAGQVDPIENNELLIAGVCYETSTTFLLIDQGFTIAQQFDYVNGGAMGNGHAYLVQSTAASKDPTWSRSNGIFGSAGATTATFKAAAGGGGGAGKPASYYAQQRNHREHVVERHWERHGRIWAPRYEFKKAA